MIQEHQTRVLVEAEDLEGKVNKLLEFIKSPKFLELRGIDQSLLVDQSVAMTGYLNILKIRISLF